MTPKEWARKVMADWKKSARKPYTAGQFSALEGGIEWAIVHAVYEERDQCARIAQEKQMPSGQPALCKEIADAIHARGPRPR